MYVDTTVFTELVETLGVKNVQVEELYALDLDLLRSLAPVYGLIFLFRYDTSIKNPNPVAEPGSYDHVYYAQQVISNACATQAITSVLFNSPDIELGDTLGSLKSFTEQFPPEMRGLALSNSEEVRRAHNSFARPEPFENVGERPAKSVRLLLFFFFARLC